MDVLLGCFSSFCSSPVEDRGAREASEREQRHHAGLVEPQAALAQVKASQRRAVSADERDAARAEASMRVDLEVDEILAAPAHRLSGSSRSFSRRQQWQTLGTHVKASVGHSRTWSSSTSHPSAA